MRLGMASIRCSLFKVLSLSFSGQSGAAGSGVKQSYMVVYGWKKYLHGLLASSSDIFLGELLPKSYLILELVTNTLGIF
jgi:hypothetical protein